MNIIKIKGMNMSGILLTPGDTYLYKMDSNEKGSMTNFRNLISILDNAEKGYERSPLKVYLHNLIVMCNQYGIKKERTYKLIIEIFSNSERVKNEFVDNQHFRDDIITQIDDCYLKFIEAFSSYHKKEDEELKETPVLPSNIYNNLPLELKNLTRFFDDGREKDVFLLSTLGVLSSCFPDIQGVYDNKLVGMNLFLFISAPASAGKGVMTWARRLGDEKHKDLESNFNRKSAEYISELKNYQPTLENGQEAKTPIKPERQLFFVPANSSSSKVIQSIKANVNFGVMFETEADTLTQALGNDWGNFSDILRKIFHHEAIELQRKTNDEYISIQKSYLSVVLSGTPNQIKNLLSSVENGFFSRFIFYDFPLMSTWRNVFDRSKESPDGEFQSMSTKLLRYSNQLNQFAATTGGPITFSLTRSQEDIFNNWFSERQARLHNIYGDQMIASIRRLGLITFRIAMILTAIRQMKCELSSSLSCSQEDFETALSMTDTLLIHTTKVYTQLQNFKETKTASGRKELFLEKLPESFNRATAMETAAFINIKEKTAENYLSEYINNFLVQRIEHNSYAKVS
jgi:hypothetical protein